jgi:hypothetical protein
MPHPSRKSLAKTLVNTSTSKRSLFFAPKLREPRDGVPATYVFRGQASVAWSLEPSLLRQIRGVLDRTSARKIEQLLENEFVAQAGLFPETQSVLPVLLDAGNLQWWAYMQHHSCPTRLLDWTASAFVGAYFAVNGDPVAYGQKTAVRGKGRFCTATVSRLLG